MLLSIYIWYDVVCACSIWKNILESDFKTNIHLFIIFCSKQLQCNVHHVAMSCHCVMKINTSFTSNANMGHVFLQAWLLNYQKRCIKNIRYIMLKHYKQEHHSSFHITNTTSNSDQNMTECNSMISTKWHYWICQSR